MAPTRKNPVDHLVRHAWLGELLVEAVRQSGLLKNSRRPYNRKEPRRPHRRTRPQRRTAAEVPATEA
jgi:hypothetical protein